MSAPIPIPTTVQSIETAEMTPYSPIEHSIGLESLEQLFYTMALIRVFETRLLTLFDQGLVQGTTHTCIGQEATAVGVIKQLQCDDAVVSNHRNHGHYIARFDDTLGLYREILGHPNGICGGRGGSQHIHRKNFYSNGVLGGTLPFAAGLAKAQKIQQNNQITAVFIGDGAFGEGVVYETLNIAALWSLPLLIVVENNAYAQSTPTCKQLAGSFEGRARAFEIASHSLTGNDVRIIATEAQRACNYVREKQKPFMLIVNSYRLGPHSKGDDKRHIHEKEYWSRFDPLNIDYGLAEPKQYQLAAKSRIDNECRELLSDKR